MPFPSPHGWDHGYIYFEIALRQLWVRAIWWLAGCLVSKALSWDGSSPHTWSRLQLASLHLLTWRSQAHRAASEKKRQGPSTFEVSSVSRVIFSHQSKHGSAAVLKPRGIGAGTTEGMATRKCDKLGGGHACCNSYPCSPVVNVSFLLQLTSTSIFT